MPGNHPSNLPQRALLSEQTAQCIRERITLGEWHGDLPSEAALCRLFQVSRVTIRRALSQLTDEKLLQPSGQGVRRRIHPDRARPVQAPIGRTVRILAPFSDWRMGAVSHAILEGLAHRVTTKDFRVEFESRPQLFKSHRPKELESLRSLPDTAGWVLFFSTVSMQRWFVTKGIPCVVAGRLHEELALSSVYPDSEAVARHAAGLLSARGHRRIGHLMASNTSLGDRLASAAFSDQASGLGLEVQRVEYSGDPASICRAVSSLIAARPSPTALFLTCPEDGVTALCHVLRAGIAVPGKLDFLIGWDDPILDLTVPSLAHYKFDGAKMGRQIGSLILKQLEASHAKTQEIRILPEFATGDSLAGSPLTAAPQGFSSS